MVYPCVLAATFHKELGLVYVSDTVEGSGSRFRHIAIGLEHAHGLKVCHAIKDMSAHLLQITVEEKVACAVTCEGIVTEVTYDNALGRVYCQTRSNR